MMLERVIFAIDNDIDTHVNAKFMRWVDTNRVMGKMGEMDLCIGCYNGVMERSYMILARDLHIVAEYIKGQESVLFIPGDVRQPCHLMYLADGSTLGLEPMVEVPYVDAIQAEGWTYCNGKYFVC